MYTNMRDDNSGTFLEEKLIGGLNQTIYIYDHRNRMATSNQLPSSSPGQYLQTYTYDGEGLRRTKATSSGVTTFVWDGADYLAEETGGALTVQYSTMNGQLVEENRGGTVTEYVPDTLGSVIKTTNSSGTVTSSTTFWPYGETNTSSGTNPSNFGFVGTWGYYTDSPTRTYVRARSYRPDLSRWLTVDPLWPGEPGYNYGTAYPVQAIDPWGLNCCTKCTDQIKPYQGDPGDFQKLMQCLENSSGSKGDIIDCFKEFGGKIGEAAWEALRDYLACEIASILARRIDVPGLGAGCDPCKSGLQPPDTQWCCYENYLKCGFGCSGKTGYQLGICLYGCYIKKGGLQDCGFSEAM